MKNQFKLKRSVLVAFLLSTSLIRLSIAATNVDIASTPLAGVTQAFPANVYLALSVEFPTAGAAYNMQKQGLNILNEDNDLKTEYLGYFDSNKCYVLTNNSYFEPVAIASVDTSGRLGQCNNGTATNQYSGNILNWATMTALDIYRSSMTGGNRALGTSKVSSEYTNGDTNTFTSLRRANVVNGQNRSYRLTDRQLRFSKQIVKKYVPHSYIANPSSSLTSLITINFDNDVFNVNIKGTANNNAVVTVPVVVQVCKSGYLESNCTQYGSDYKPEGLMQKNVKKMNFAALGYLNISGAATNKTGGNQISGGVVRSELNSIRNEFNESNGRFIVNPFVQTGVNNSGSINYLNKFGDANGYKTNDPVAELYYTTLRYIRAKGYVNNVNWIPSNLTNAEKDDFPVIDINGKDPFKTANGSWDMQKVCSKNTIMLIGDTNSHQDGHLPNLTSTGGFRPSDDNEINTLEYINKIKAAELSYIGAPANSSFMNNFLYNNMGSSNSPAGLPALAYWANTQNVRADLPRKVTVQTFAIDVLENTDYKIRTVAQDGYPWVRNAYYLAGKYGGFVDKNGDGVPNRSDPSEWTDDPVQNGQVISSIPQFEQGKPKNFALANNPASMVTALEQAFSQVSAATDVSQTGVTTSSSVDLIDVDNDLIIRSAYNDRNWSGDVIAFRLNASDTAVWRANDLLKTNTTRNIFAHDGNTVRAFTAANAAAFSNALSGNVAVTPQNLIEYVRGNTSLETGSATGLRPRLGNKLGTVVNSQIISIKKPITAPSGCTYSNSGVLNRAHMYGVAANDGMYHVLDNNGNERFAYIPFTAVEKLNAYANPAYNHQYINDGSSVAAEVCFANVARSVVIGSAGRGGRAVYTLDVTDLSNPSAANVLWEFSHLNDSDFGHFIGKPILSEDANGNPIAIVSSGYNSNSNNGYLYILQLNKTGGWVQGVNYHKIALGEAGVGAPFGYDIDSNGVVDSVYVGDLAGKLWKINAQADGWAVAFNGQPLFQAPTDAYITAAPYVQVTRGRLTVFVGTGRYFSNNDFNPSIQNYAYGIFDTGVAITDTATQILEQTIASDDNSVAGLEGRLWMLSSNAMASQHLGWRITLRPGQMIVDQAHVQSKRVAFFNVFTPMPANNCLEISQTFLLGADVRSGAQYPEALYDTNDDGVVDHNDGVGGFYKLGDMLGPVGTMLQTTDGRLLYMVIGSDGVIYQLDLNALVIPPSNLKYKRLSWREIF